jgi:hypothetical protein
MRIAVGLRRKEEERKRREAEEQKREQERVQLREEIEEEEKKLKQLNTWVDDWERAERMRRFITVYVKKTKSWNADKQPRRKAWIEWATRQAERTDPFVSEKPSSVLDRKHELRSW